MVVVVLVVVVVVACLAEDRSRLVLGNTEVCEGFVLAVELDKFWRWSASNEAVDTGADCCCCCCPWTSAAVVLLTRLFRDPTTCLPFLSTLAVPAVELGVANMLVEAEVGVEFWCGLECIPPMVVGNKSADAASSSEAAC